MWRLCTLGFVSVSLFSCAVSNSQFSVSKKYSPQELEKDFHVYRTLLEELHPGLYWYTPQDSMNMYFEEVKQQLTDSLTELEFRKLLTYVTSKMHCGHTTVRSSRRYARYADTARSRVFPLSVKAWAPDTVVVTSNLNRRDSLVRRGVLLHRVNGVPVPQLVAAFFQYISSDGNNLTHKYQSISNRGTFGGLHRLLYGASAAYQVEFSDESGVRKTLSIPAYDPTTDTAGRAALTAARRLPTPSRRERRERRLNSVRQLRIDTLNQTAFLDLTSFGRGYRLKRFYRETFRRLKEDKLPYLVIDLRSNGGGSVTNSTSLSRYIASKPFKVADSLYAIRKRGSYNEYIQYDFWNRIFITLFARRRKDGKYHFGYFERHHFRPRKKNHYDGKVYVLTGGNSFSASTLFVSSVRGQQNVRLVGEETGGAAYGNTAWLIPDVTLPKTKIRFRLPLFRLVIDRDLPKNGQGVQPDVTVGPTVEAIRSNKDFKMEAVLKLIRNERNGVRPQ